MYIIIIFVKPVTISFEKDFDDSFFLDKAIIILITIDILSNFISATYKKGIIVENVSHIAKYYFRDRFKFDLFYLIFFSVGTMKHYNYF